MAANDFPHEKCCGPLLRGVVTSAEHDVVVDEAATATKLVGAPDIIWLDFLGVEVGTENAAEIPMTDDTADAATTAVAADRGLRGCRETMVMIIYVLWNLKMVS